LVVRIIGTKGPPLEYENEENPAKPGGPRRGGPGCHTGPVTELWQLGVSGLRAAYARGDTSPVEVVEECIDRIEALDLRVGAITTKIYERALHEARVCAGAGKHERPPLHGIPVVVKEIFDVAGAETTYGSAALRGRVPKVDGDAVGRLRRAGAVVVAMSRSHEFAWGITTQSKHMGGTRNPWDLGRVPGGSSGGSAAAVALGYVPVALGSDTGGSIRIPSCFCGVSGFKPSWGRIPMGGACPLAPSLDHGGVVARLPADLVEVSSVVGGRTPRVTGADFRSLRLGFCRDSGVIPPTAHHRDVFDATVDAARSLGWSPCEVSIGSPEHLYDVFSRIQLFEAYRVHRQDLRLLPEREHEYSAAVAARLVLARDVTATQYRRACAERREIRRRFAAVFEEVDVLLSPITAGGPSRVERPDYAGDETGLRFRDLVMPFTVPQNLAGTPACAIFAGFDGDGLPIGVQLCAPAGEDDRCLAAAAALAEAVGGPPWPPLAFEA